MNNIYYLIKPIVGITNEMIYITLQCTARYDIMRCKYGEIFAVHINTGRAYLILSGDPLHVKPSNGKAASWNNSLRPSGKQERKTHSNYF